MPGVPFPGAFRASDADRERVVDLLNTAFVQGWLTRDELGLHTARALESRTYAQLAAVTAGLPAARPPLNAPPVRKPVKRKVVAGGAATILLSTAVWVAFLTYYGGFFILFMLAFVGMAMSAGPRPSRHSVTSAPARTGIRRT